MTDSTLGAFLRARRERLSPARVGLPGGGHRRTPGLRREEVAARAGVTVDYYARLEQGRGRNPTESVVEALARALLLSGEERDYLHRLARRSGAGVLAAPEISRHTRSLLDTLDRAPAYVVDARLDVLACNRAARLLLGDACRDVGGDVGQDVRRDGGGAPAAGRNLLWLLYAGRRVAELFDAADLEAVRRGLVAGLRARSPYLSGDPATAALLRRLTAASPAFRREWREYRVEEPRRGPLRMRHPLVGEIPLDYTVLDLPECGQRLVTHLAPPAGPARRAVALLAANNRPGREEPRPFATRPL
ncbi:helix-turn-helix transcriptional regulator [Allostreptomyces psammosilenae]|uniref:Transcriptional regulator with XRE-family HTH domain n=1 Tax=Allostreptomyces psammosilenae TaxID=1892865 RepID=A0A852ZSW3_9ACTN|nr:helix-turn-helix transcriptional regulator [Allostreptomyces psammosilenae]NYI05493.1 transcriptional regulator with XRE-family HTH domain [Allostreptomyces psammosilenae]